MTEVYYALRRQTLLGHKLDVLDKLPAEVLKHVSDEKLRQLVDWKFVGRVSGERYRQLTQQRKQKTKV